MSTIQHAESMLQAGRFISECVSIVIAGVCLVQRWDSLTILAVHLHLHASTLPVSSQPQSPEGLPSAITSATCRNKIIAPSALYSEEQRALPSDG